MQRSSSAPQPADRKHAGTSPSSAGLFSTGPDPGLPSPLVFAPVMLRRHCSYSASSGGLTSPLSAQSAATAAPASTASSPARALWEDLKSPTISFGTFRSESFGLGVRPEPSLSIETRQVPEPSPRSIERVPCPSAPPTPVSVEHSTPRPKAEEEKEDAKQQSADSNKVPGTGPGACIVCLEDCDNVVDSDWLHRLAASSSASDVGGTDCTVTACISCLKTYFTGIVEAGFDGACPRMRCMCCPRVVCEWVWAPLVEATVLETFQKRAATLLSIQCGMCHSRGTIMVKPPADHCYSSALDKLMAMIASGLASAAPPAATTATAITTQGSPADTKSTTNGGDSSAASSTCNAQRMEIFRARLERYISGHEIDPSLCYIALEAAIANPGIGQAAQESRDELMVLLMSCIEDSERRANLHIRFIRSNPMVVTQCCKSLHCYPCRVVGGHHPQTCEQYEAGRGHQDVCKCPGCGVYVVKGDGCDSIRCVCGHDFGWSELVAARHRRIADAFRDAHPEDTGRAAAHIIRRGPPTAAELGAGPQEDIDEHVGARGDIEEQQQQGHEYPLDPPAATVAGAEGGESEQGEDAEEGQPATGGAWGEPVGHWEPVEDGAWGQRWVPGVEQGPGAGADAWQPNQEPVQEMERAPLHGTGQGTVEEERDEPVPVPGENGRLSAEDEFRLANAYAEAYPRELGRGRAVIYGEENPHFTVQRALAQSNHLSPLLALSYFPQPRPASTSETEAAWLTRAAEDWLTANQGEVNAVRRRDEAARSSLVEAFYSGDDLLRHIAAEYARSALRVAAPFTSVAATDRPRAFWSRLANYQQQQADGEQNGEPLFKWLGIVEPPPLTGDQSTWEEDDDGAVADEDAWEVPFADAEIEEETFEVLPPPRTLFTPWPSALTGTVSLRPTPPSSRGHRRALDPANRLVSATSTFGTLNLRAEVELWVAGSNIRQEGLRRQMAVQESELSNAWVALWGRRRRLDPVSKTWVDADDSGDAAVRAAARRVVFLEAHPEQVCQEQGAMMKAFVRRNGAGVLKAVEEADAELAAAWERTHDNRDDVEASHSSTTPPASTSPSTFDRAYAAYRKHINTRASAALVANSLPPTSAASATLQLRRMCRMADAWESANHRRVCARRFADHFSGAAGAEKVEQEGEALPKRLRESRAAANEDAAAFGAVVALVVAPMLIGRASQMCECDMGPILSNAVDWVAFNGEAFEEELQRMETRPRLPPGTTAGKDVEDEGCSGGGMGRMLDGCECELESSVSSCRRLVACPIVTRRILRVPEPVCPECEDDSGVFGTDLFDLFA
ncbi:unnamed protein product [Ectocarpus sp. 4 AP-2014]